MSEVLVDHRYWETQTEWCNGHFSRPIALVLTVSTTLDRQPPECGKYRFNHCLPGMATNAENRRCVGPVAVATSLGRTAGVSLGMVDADYSFGLSWRFECALMAVKAVPTTESRRFR